MVRVWHYQLHIHVYVHIYACIYVYSADTVLANLRLNDLLLAVGLQPCPVHLTVKVANVTADGIVFHCHEVLWLNDRTAASGRDKDVGSSRRIIHCGHFIPCTHTHTHTHTSGSHTDGGHPSMYM